MGGNFHFDIGSAGSTSLVLQTVLPILLEAGGPSTVTVRGGTHNSMAPPFEFLAESLVPVLHRIGVSVALELGRHGFYPAGGGELRATVQPGQSSVPLALHERGKHLDRHAEVLLSNLPAHVAHRESTTLKHALKWSHDEVDETEVRADGPGNALVARLRHANVTGVFTAFGELRRSAETVANDAAKQVERWLRTPAAACPHLADQLLLPLALGAGGSFTTGAPTDHTTTNAAIIALFLGEVVTIAERGEGVWLVTVRGRR